MAQPVEMAQIAATMRRPTVLERLLRVVGIEEGVIEKKIPLFPSCQNEVLCKLYSFLMPAGLRGFAAGGGHQPPKTVND
jgi:hypothetical protein